MSARARHPGGPGGPYDDAIPSGYGDFPDYDSDAQSHRGGDDRRPSRGRRELFQAKPTSATAVIPDGYNVLQGTRDVAKNGDPFVPRTVYLSCSSRKPLYSLNTAGVLVPNAIVAGFVTVEIIGHQPGTPWTRIITLAVGQSQQIKVETFQDVSIRVLHSTAAGASLDAVVTEEMSYGTGAEDLGFLAVHYPPGIYPRPPGAVSFLPSAADAAFAWICGGPGANVTIVDAVLALTEKTAKGPVFQVVAVAGLDLEWKISLL